MPPSNEYKFNINTKSRAYFFLKQFRFNTDAHPIRTSRKELKYRIKTLVTQQEELMIEGLTNTLQCDKREALRIAFYEVCRRAPSKPRQIKIYIPYASRSSTLQGHTSRDRELVVSLTKSEKDTLLSLANDFDLSEKEVFRLAFIWLQKSIKSGAIKNIHKCKLIAQDKLARQWSRENKGKEPNPNTKNLRGEIEAWAEIYEMEGEIRDVLPMNPYVEDLFTKDWIPKEELFDEALTLGEDIRRLDAQERRIFSTMYLWEVSREEAELMVNDAYEEYNRYMKMSKRELVQEHKKALEEQKKSQEAMEEFELKQREEKLERAKDTDYDLERQEYKDKETQRIKDLVIDFYRKDKQTNELP